MTTTRTAWQAFENTALVALYFAMLDRAMAGIAYNKAQMIRDAMGEPSWQHPYCGKLDQRSRGSIEAKLMNASACHADLVPGAETMAAHGYKAWGNYQAALKDAMHKRIDPAFMSETVTVLRA